MFIRKKKYPSGNIGIIIVEKIGGKMKELATIGVAYSENEVESLVSQAKEWILKKNLDDNHNWTCMVRSVRRATESEKKSVGTISGKQYPSQRLRLDFGSYV